MTNKELIEILSQFPPSAEIYREADHGQKPERDCGVCVSLEKFDKFPYYGEDIEWLELESVNSDEKKDVTAILIY